MTTQGGPFELGRTTSQLGEASNLGMERIFEDYDYSVSGIKPRLSGGKVNAMLVKNSSGGALNAGLAVTFKAGSFRKEIGALAGANADADGIIDPYLNSSGVADTDYFWIIRRGPCNVVSNGDAIIEKSRLSTAANGQVALQTAAPADTTAVMVQIKAYVGKAMVNPADVAGTVFRAEIDLESK